MPDVRWSFTQRPVHVLGGFARGECTQSFLAFLRSQLAAAEKSTAWQEAAAVELMSQQAAAKESRWDGCLVSCFLY